MSDKPVAASAAFWSGRSMVRILACHARDRSSILRRTAIYVGVV